MKNKDFEILFLSERHRNELCAEVQYENKAVAEISQEHGIDKALIDIWGSDNKELFLGDFLDTLNQAFNSLKETKRNDLEPTEHYFKQTPLQEGTASCILITYRERLVAKITKSDSGIKILIMPPEEGGFWEFKHSEFVEQLRKAQKSLNNF